MGDKEEIGFLEHLQQYLTNLSLTIISNNSQSYVVTSAYLPRILGARPRIRPASWASGQDVELL